METQIFEVIGTLGFGGGGIVVVAYFAYHYGKAQLENHKAELTRMCESFDRALDRRDKDIEDLVDEVRSGRSGIINH